jgi:hypothetical protein
MNKAAQQLGSLGGKVTSEAKARASRRNGKLGGRPKGKPRKPKQTKGEQ